MAVFALTSVTTTLNSSDVTSLLKSATLTVDAAQLDTTDFASGGWVEMIGGLKSGSLSLEFMDDLADDGLDEDLWTIFGTVVAFTVKGTSASVDADNPQYSGNVLITSMSLGGSVGDLAGKSLTFPLSGAISRAVS
jgi:predicted secreted protein